MATLSKQGGKWTIRYREKNGKQKRKTLSSSLSKREANLVLQQFEQERAKPILSSPSFEDYVSHEYLLAHKMRTELRTHQRVIGIVRKHFLPSFGYLPMSSFDHRILNQYFVRRKELVRFGTLEKELNTIKAIFAKAFEEKVIFDNPVKSYSLGKNTEDKPPPYYKADEIDYLFANSSMKARWQLAVNTGLRRGELLQLKHDHIQDGFIYVVSTEEARTKSGKSRQIPLSDKAEEAIDELKYDDAWDKHMDKNYVFPRMHPASLTRAYRNHIERLQLPGSLHWLRHTFCTYHVLNGTPIRAIQLLAGHSTIAVTERYTHVINELEKYKGNVNVG